MQRTTPPPPPFRITFKFSDKLVLWAVFDRRTNEQVAAGAQRTEPTAIRQAWGVARKLAAEGRFDYTHNPDSVPSEDDPDTCWD